MSHTPGPWRVWVDSEPHHLVHLNGGNPPYELSMRNPDNLALIAAAPELLEHAKAVMDLLDQHGESIVSHLMDTDDNPGQYLRAAIRKATS